MKKLAALIVEDRYFDDTAKICKEHLDKLPQDTDLIFYTIPEQQEKYQKELDELGVKVIFKEYNQNMEVPLTIKYIAGMESLMQNERMKALLNYCLVMTDREFWLDLFDYDRVLTFQRDSGITRKGIDEFMKYDYVGAPCYNFVRDQTIQNGGFSLRNPRIMEYVCRMHGWRSDLQDLMVVGQYSTASFFAEDIFFCLRMIKYNIGNFAPLDIAKKFSVESRFEPNAFGYHRIEAYLTEDEIKQIKK